MQEQPIQLELPFDAVRIQTTEQLLEITQSQLIMRLYIADLLALAEKLYIRNGSEVVTGVSDVDSLIRISRFLVGRVSEMRSQQKKSYQLLVARLAQFVPVKK